MSRRPQSAAQLQAACDKFNATHQVGAAVTVQLDGGEIRETVTTSEAQVLSGHSAVIWLKGVSGCYLLNRVASAVAV
jgi:alpha-ketoglutarate-dependent taurine dioxygenase